MAGVYASISPTSTKHVWKTAFLVESTAGNELLTFMNAFSDYNQIMMHPYDREMTGLIIDQVIFCNKIMPFSLKTLEQCIKDWSTRCSRGHDGNIYQWYDCQVFDRYQPYQSLERVFQYIERIWYEAESRKMYFWRYVMSGEFLSYIVTLRGIKANPEKSYAILDLSSLKNSCKVQYLTGWVTVFNGFISRSIDKFLPFYIYNIDLCRLV